MRTKYGWGRNNNRIETTIALLLKKKLNNQNGDTNGFSIKVTPRNPFQEITSSNTLCDFQKSRRNPAIDSEVLTQMDNHNGDICTGSA